MLLVGWPVKNLEWWDAGLEQGADLHLSQLMSLPLTVSCFSKIHIGSAFLVLAHLSSPRKRAVKWCVCVLPQLRQTSPSHFSYFQWICYTATLTNWFN